jgi:hypothetical protein
VDPLLRFYRLEGPDARGRLLSDIWTWDAGRLEGVHDYIQWLFPLAEPSAFNPDAPLVTAEVANAFRGDSELQARLRRSLALMLDFYGLTLTERDGGVTIARAPDFAAKSRGWLHAGDHNHLRLTRMLTSLRLLGLADHSRALHDCLDAIARERPDAVSATTREYWRRAGSGAPA